MASRRKRQSGQALVLVAVSLLALIGSAALVLLAGSAEWQKDQLQALADSSALDSALKIGIGCNAGAASTVITEADNFIATQRTRTGALAIAAGTCATPYQGTDTFAGGLSATYNYPYRGRQQQVQVTLTLVLPIAFGGEVGQTNTSVSRYAVAQALPASVPAVSATTLSCTGGQLNVSGDVVTQNAITLSGGCAIYAHQRTGVGAASSFGDVSVYADSQTWVGAGGSCIAASTSGSTNAICADGHELSGHATPACGGVSQYLSPADLAINPNPCAAGVGRTPVTPLSAVQAPDPNTDASAIATLQGTGGAACSPVGVYPNIVAGGTTWGTGLAPLPLKDAAGLYHFKPSCYGYLNFGSLRGGITNRQTGPESVPQKHFVTAALPGASVAGTLLVATITSESTPNKFVAPAGWIAAAEADQAGAGRAEIWYYPSNPGGIPSVQFTITPASIFSSAQITEWSGAAVLPFDQGGALSTATPTASTTISTAGATSLSGELVITAEAYKIAAGKTFTRGASWLPLVNDPPNSFSSEYRLDLPAAVASETMTTNQTTPWANVIATFKPLGSAVSAVLDPGFYYFNGSGFAGGGGICLNGGSLQARDVTLEFVNQAGFSTGTCAPGGGAACAGTCQFGSTPCSISACPPNAPVDAASGGGYTWFAAPCAQAPAGDNSCPGSAWCPVGDRSCWNLLAWSAPAATGQLAIKGSVSTTWLLGTVSWSGTCSYQANGTSTIAGSLACGTLSLQAGAGAGTAVGGDYGINTAAVEAALVE